jgi:dihydroorotate dehydrogenase
MEAEAAHDLALGFSVRHRTAIRPFALSAVFQPPPQPQVVFGVTFPNPVGLAAGFDKNGVALPALAALGFGFVEIGTVTARAQPGNSRPRMFRYSGKEALINRLGFNNDGADMVANRLRQLRESGRWPAIPIGINIGKSKITPLDERLRPIICIRLNALRNFATTLF